MSLKHMNAELQSRALLVSISITGWSARKLDRKVSEDVAKQHNAKARDADNVGRYNKVLVAHDALTEYEKRAGQARREHYDLSLPWGDDGWRILAADAWQDYDAKMTVARDDLDRIADKIIDAYPDMKEQARTRLGDLFSEEDYPHPDQVRRKFSFWRGADVISTSADLRVQFNNMDHEKIAEQIDNMVNSRLQRAVEEPWNRVHGVLTRIVDRLHDYDDAMDNDRRAVLHDTVITNAQDLAAILPMLNITGDAQLAQVAEDLQTKICSLDVRDLKKMKTARQNATQDAQALLDKMAGYGFQAA